MKKRYVIFLIVVLIVILGTGFYFLLMGNKGGMVEFVEEINETEEYKVEVEYPEGHGVGIEEVKSYIDKKVDDFKERAVEEVRRMREDGFSYKYTLNLGGDVYRSGNFISYVLYMSEYTGGANVNQVVKSFVFDKRSNKQVLLSDILSEEEVGGLLGEVRLSLEKREEASDVFPGVSDEISLDNLDDFYVTDLEFVFLFSKYEVAPGAAGIVEIEVDRL